MKYSYFEKNIYNLDEEEKKNKNLDIICGFEVLDKDFRVFVLEGLSEKGMRK